ncbi:uncharacterized protein [Cebidichthys violaceus]|uniref:uncharacterized protein n=1 Tax=Cebidichthys violaceus TaxID=271503 RepID=UPI0035CB6A5E
MQLLCIAALLLSAVAAQPGSRKPWQYGKHPPAGGPKLDADSKRGDGEQSVTPAPEDGEEGSGRCYSDHHSQASTLGKDQVPGFTSDGPGGYHHGPGRQFWRHRGGQRPNRRIPSAVVFCSVFKVDNVTFQNVTDVTLKEGKNIFLMPKHGGRGPHHHKGGRHRHPKNGQFVKLIYNATEPNKVSVEFGVFKPMNLGKFIGEENNPDEDY